MYNGLVRLKQNIKMGSAVDNKDLLTYFTVASRYRLMRKLGSGSFGDIYLGIDITNGEVSYAYLLFYKLYIY